jgi:hypothetical protein
MFGAGTSWLTRPKMEAAFASLACWTNNTRQCLAIHPAWSIRAVDVITAVEAAIAHYGVPEHLRSDNRPEFIATWNKQRRNTRERNSRGDDE